MRTPLAWHNLLHNKVKTSVAIAGVVFAIVLMFMQLGFLEAVRVSATIIYDVLDFDVCIRSRDYLHLAAANTIPRARLVRASGVQGVASIVPFTIANHRWLNERSGEGRAILCFGVRPDDALFRDPQIESEVRARLVRADDLLIDTRSRSEYGPANGERFGPEDVGDFVEVSGRRMQIAGYYACGAGLSSAGTAILRDDGLRDVSPFIPPGHISLGLIKLQPGESADVLVTRLRQVLGNDVDVRSRQGVLQDELAYWVDETSYGLIFRMGVVLALIVGTAIVYQVLASDVASKLPEYATLKAMGYGNRYLASVVLQQALILALAGFACGLAIAQLLYLVTSAGAQIPIRMTWANASLVFAMSVTMCVLSGLGALRKAFRADPAELF
ncbi:MAG: FtsX-like permease family protein [Pirellulaceae bacterium]